jgi:hypothetical protein
MRVFEFKKVSKRDRAGKSSGLTSSHTILSYLFFGTIIRP